MRLLCVGRHAYLAEHIAALFRARGAEACPVVGLDMAAQRACADAPDVVLCEYDLLATNPLGAWERDPVLSRVPVVAVSLTRRPHEACAFDVNGIAGFLYLPTLDHDAALRTLSALAARGAGGTVVPASAGAYSLPVRPSARPATALP